MEVAPQVFDDPNDVAAQLATLGLRLEPLAAALRKGYVARMACSLNDPVSFPGTTFWAKTTCGLRDELLPLGWRKVDDSNYPLTISPDGSIALVVATGNECTGITQRTPKTNRPKGKLTRDAVSVNRQQIDLFADSEIGIFIAKAASSWKMWVLLIKDIVVDGRHYVRAELSLPLVYGDDRRISDWHTRIVLPVIIDDDDRDELLAPEPGPEFDVDIQRRGA